ncbi:MAG: QueT transporter family protein [Oscillibacter sp.]|nr:QueT transporter family protein [Oscillibacter sp.]
MPYRRFTTRQLAVAGITAALYAVLSCFASVLQIAFGPIQCRFSEALCVLPFFFPETVPGLFIGCLVSNLLSPYGALDIVFGSLATLLAALWTRRMPCKWLAPLPPVVCNAVLVGGVIAFEQTGAGLASVLPGGAAARAFALAFLYNAATIGLGELLACFVLGGMLLSGLPRIPALRRRMVLNRSPKK